MRAVNLLPRDLERQGSEGRRAPLFVAVGGVAVVTVAAAFLAISASGESSDQRSQLDSVEAAIAQMQTTAPSVSPAVSGLVAQERTDRVAALAAALSTRVRFDRLLRELAYVLPADVWLTGLTASAPASSAAAGASPSTTTPSTADGVTITGATYSQASVARVLARLNALPSLDRVRLTETSRNDPQADDAAPATKNKKKRRAVVTFTISGALATGSTS
jgi:Tfp pilus assembly protein PilN